MSGRFGKPDATGRSSGKIVGRQGKLMKPPKGEPWIWLTRELVTSDAWTSLSINGRRVIDRLLVEHMNHAGTENGCLKSTYEQFEEFGATARFIPAAVDEVEQHGLVDVQRGGKNIPNTYALTFFALWNGTPATNRWKQYRCQKNRILTPQREGNLPYKGKATAPALPYKGKVVATLQREGPSISRRDSPSNSTPSPSATIGNNGTALNGVVMSEGDILGSYREPDRRLPWHKATYIEIPVERASKPASSTPAFRIGRNYTVIRDGETKHRSKTTRSKS